MIIYRATAPNGKAYIGQTIYTLSARRRDHERHSRNGSLYPFHCAIRKYGKAIKWEVIAKADSIAALNALEAVYIALYNTMIPHGYNAREGGKNAAMSTEAKAKISATMKARFANMTDEERAALSATGKRRWAKMPDADRAKIGAKITERLTGRKLSPEHIAKISKPRSAETRAKMSEMAKGRKHSPETLAKISAASKAAWAAKSPEERAAWTKTAWAKRKAKNDKISP